jgi:hypothetical protein
VQRTFQGLSIQDHSQYLNAVQFHVKDCPILCYGTVECRFLRIDTRASTKKNVRPVNNCIHTYIVVYRGILRTLTVTTQGRNIATQSIPV